MAEAPGPARGPRAGVGAARPERAGVDHPAPRLGIAGGTCPAPFRSRPRQQPTNRAACLHQQPCGPRQVLACRGSCRRICRASCRGTGRPRQVAVAVVLGWLAVARHGAEQHDQLGDHLGVLDVRRQPLGGAGARRERARRRPPRLDGRALAASLGVLGRWRGLVVGRGRRGYPAKPDGSCWCSRTIRCSTSANSRPPSADCRLPSPTWRPWWLHAVSPDSRLPSARCWNSMSPSSRSTTTSTGGTTYG